MNKHRNYQACRLPVMEWFDPAYWGRTMRGAQNDCIGSDARHIAIELLALAKLARRFATPEGVHLHQNGKAKASEAPRTLHTDGRADASIIKDSILYI